MHCWETNEWAAHSPIENQNSNTCPPDLYLHGIRLVATDTREMVPPTRLAGMEVMSH
jgi:hypothetical protein